MHSISPPPVEFHPRATPDARVEQIDDSSWRLTIPPGPAGKYRLAQLDDYMHRARSDFAWQPPLALELRARVSGGGLPGTWGFGFWNDPFAVPIGLKGADRRLPALPNTAWFFHASPPNYLALRDYRPAVGFLASTFSAPKTPALVFAPAVLLLPLLAWRVTARVLRKAARRLVGESAWAVDVDPTLWHQYRLELNNDHATFQVDGALTFETVVNPRGPLGLVIWIDNQYAAFPPDGRLRFGTLATPPGAWLEIAGLLVEPLN